MGGGAAQIVPLAGVNEAFVVLPIEDLKELLANMHPVLAPDVYVFCTFPEGSYGDLAELQPVASFMEVEGLTLVVKRELADAHGCDYAPGTMRMISLKVYSSLTAVGLTAAISGQLTRYGISANIIAGYHHDHVFVPEERAEEAVQALGVLSAMSLKPQG